jgi:hypothetical protein
MAEYKPELPEDIKLPEGHSINTAHADYKALEALATRHGWSQAAFSETLGLEAKRTMAKVAAAPAPAAAATPAVPDNWDKLSTREQMHRALERSAAKRRGS